MACAEQKSAATITNCIHIVSGTILESIIGSTRPAIMNFNASSFITNYCCCRMEQIGYYFHLLEIWSSRICNQSGYFAIIVKFNLDFCSFFFSIYLFADCRVLANCCEIAQFVTDFKRYRDWKKYKGIFFIWFGECKN